jgi:benzoate 4-monooxygenase
MRIYPLVRGSQTIIWSRTSPSTSSSPPLASHTLTQPPSLQQVINETLRIHSTSSLGLPRLAPSTPPTGVTVAGHHFPPGTVLSVPAYTIHHSTSIWGPDADSFRPERWAPGVLTEQQKNAFIPFSYGPRSCVGRNVAEMELALIVSTVAGGYEFELREEVLETREGFLRKPVKCFVGMRRREKR